MKELITRETESWKQDIGALQRVVYARENFLIRHVIQYTSRNVNCEVNWLEYEGKAFN